MATIQPAAAGTGLDVNTIVSQLMTVERQPLTALDTQQSGITAKLSAYGSLKSVLASLQDAASAAADASKFNTAVADIADTSLASASAVPGTAAGTHLLEVQTLAQAQKLKSVAFASTATTLGSGTLTVEFGSYTGGAFALNPDRAAKSIAIPAGTDSLAAVRDAINAAGAGVSASIVNDGSGQRLVIGSDQSGASNAMRITVADDDGNNTDAAGLSRLAYDASTGGTANLTQTIAAQDSVIVVDGITVQRSSNSVSDAIEGVTLNLLKAAPGSPSTITVSRDSSAATAAIGAFVNAYNNAASTMQSLSAYDASTQQAAVLQGDPTLISLQSRLRSVLGAAIANASASGYGSLSAIGVSFQRDGSLAIDSTKLQAALNDPSRDVAGVFTAFGKPSDSLIAWTRAASTAVPGNYALNVTRLATQGQATGSAAAALQVTAGVNDTLQLQLDGVAATVTLAAGSYSAQSLAAALQSRINGDAGLAAAGAAASVAASGGVLSIISARYGAASSVAIAGGNAAADLFGGSPSSAAGLDAQGTIGGVAATGAGQFLSAQGLTVQVNGGATGARGSVNFTRGYGDQLGSLIGDLLDGPLAIRTDGLNASISDIGRQRDELNTRLATIEQRYRAQYTALDQMLTSMQSTSNFLTQQLANLPTIGKN